MATITYNESPTAQLNPWRIPPGYQQSGIPRAEIVFSTQFTILALGAGDDFVVNLIFTPPTDYYYRVVELSFTIGATVESDLDDLDEACFVQFRNFRDGGTRVQTQTVLMPMIAKLYTASTSNALRAQSVTSSVDRWTQYCLPVEQPLPGMILSRLNGAGDVAVSLDNPNESSVGAWTAYGFCRMLQYDVSDEFVHVLHTPVPSVRG